MLSWMNFLYMGILLPCIYPNWNGFWKGEKTLIYFMVNKGIVLGHHIFMKGLEIDKTTIEII